METPLIFGEIGIPNLPREKVQSIPPHRGQWAKVSEFIDSNTHSWDMDKLLSVISSEEARAISRIPISYSNGVDKIIWVHSSSGNYSVKSGYYQAKTVASKEKCPPPPPPPFYLLYSSKVYVDSFVGCSYGFKGSFIHVESCSELGCL